MTLRSGNCGRPIPRLRLKDNKRTENFWGEFVGIFKSSALAAFILGFGLTANMSVANATWDEAMKAFAKKEYAAAAKLFRPLAEKGNALAQYRIAMMHKMGLGVSKDQKQARKWSRLAAKQGNADAQLLLGSLYYKSEGGESPDVVRAYAWYDASAEQGNAEAKKEIASISKEMNPQQIAEAQEKAKKCKSSNYEQCD